MPRPTARKPARKPPRADGRVSLHVLVPAGLAARLRLLADLRGVDRSTLAAGFLDAGLRSYKIDADLRALLGQPADPAAGAA